LLGFLINPIAGMGGTVALHGTDGSAWRRALDLGADPVAAGRADRALARIARAHPHAAVLAAPGPMGEEAVRARGFDPAVTNAPVGEITTAADTAAAAAEMLERGVALLLFVGGDGTARDIVGVVGTDVLMLGVPAGVKMHSGVFGTTPEAAGDIAAGFLARPDDTRILDVEVLDVEEERARRDQIAVVPFAAARVPYVPDKMQRAKASPVVHDDGAINALCEELAADMVPGRYYVIGPGTTTARILTALGVAGTVTGVDVVRNGRLVAADASEAELVALLSDGTPATLVLGVIGGQGFLLGRGNQQISPRVLALVDEEDVVIVAGAEKVAALDPPVLYVDLGGTDEVTKLSGYQRVRTGPKAATMLRVVG
jgi:predicted polyphosphate/ATP-dependent NAD kinase